MCMCLSVCVCVCDARRERRTAGLKPAQIFAPSLVFWYTMTREAGHGEQQQLSLTMHTCTRTSHTHTPLLNMLRPLSCTPLLLYSTTHISFIKPSNIQSLPHTQRAYILHTLRAAWVACRRYFFFSLSFLSLRRL